VRSTTVPATSPRAIIGAASAMAMPPSQAVASVSCQVSQPMAMRCTHTPTLDVAMPAR
jgi:hypothetical protein